MPTSKAAARPAYAALAGLLPVAAALALVLLAWQGPGPIAACGLLAALSLVALQVTWQDASAFMISDTALVALGLIGLASRLALGAVEAEPLLSSLRIAALEAALCGGAFWLLREVYYRRRGYDGLGFGDVKLAAAAGLLLGIEGFAWTTLAASLAGLALALVLRMRTADGPPAEAPMRLPFGALLAPALWLAWLGTAGLTLMRADPGAPFGAG